ncbi:hypothetical protein CRG98_014670 [Punica granatum]|uniref:Uncharacterized protein n=1 Tax=Punica granatum TaxID=22663 RepID=A0A2I0K8P9_PUNGR|nr:hypothetical protein CRG98_014670 [Punica granatum]
MGRGPLAGGRSGSPGTAAMALRVAVLAPGRCDDGTRGRGRWLWALLGLRVSDLDFTGVETTGIEGKSRVFRRGFPKSIDPLIGQIEGKFLVFSYFVLFLPLRIVDLSI